MNAILPRIREVGVQNKIIMTEYERGVGHSLPPSKQGGSTHNSHYGLANLNEEYGKGGDTGQFGNVQESERYIIHVSGTNLLYCTLAPQTII